MIRRLVAISILLAAVASCPSPSTAQTAYAVVLGNQAYVVGSSTLHSGLFRSTDAGGTWEHLGPRNLKAYTMDAVDAERGRVLYIAAGNGVHHSSDAGATWRIITGPGITEVLDVTVDQADPRWIYAATAFGFRRSSDSGTTWERPEGPLSERYVYRIDELEFPGAIYASTDDGVYESLDYGSTWQRKLALPTPRGVYTIHGAAPVVATAEGPVMLDRTMRAMIAQPGAPVMNVYSAAFDPNGRVFCSGDRGVWVYSLLGGWTQWREITGALPERRIHAVAYDAASDVLLAGSWGSGVYGYSNGRWSPAGLPGSQVWDIVVKPWR